MAGRSPSRSGRRQRANRKLLQDALRSTAAKASDVRGVQPEEALAEVLDRTYSWFVHAQKKVSELDEQGLWRETIGFGRIPHEWVRLESDLRRELVYMAARMMGLDFEGRRAKAAEVMAEALAPVLEGVFADLVLTKAQRERVPEIVAKHLRVLEQPSGDGDGSSSSNRTGG